MKKYILILLFFVNLSLHAQSGRKMTRKEYIETYCELAMAEMERTGIPASITLAQGVFESGDGNSTLARKANNHFGIKCHEGWDGKKVYHDDDEKNECFRKYKTVEDSYRDHSEFLITRKRYAFLFEYKKDDYKAWARGLKEAGYATSSSYSSALIKVVEDNELYKYDKLVLAKTGGTVDRKKVFSSPEFAGSRKVYYNNRVKYVLAREGENFNDLSEELDLLSWQLPRYNDMTEATILKEGEKVYLQPKRNRAEAGKIIHIVKEGETLKSISQIYAIKAEKLAARNLLSVDSPIKPGDELNLRKRKKGTPLKLNVPKIEVKEKEQTDEIKIDFDSGK
jgi:LysM repeat protein